MDASDAPAIVADGLVRRFDRTVAVDRVSLRVEHGEVFGLVGPDGAGKTTLLRMLAGVLDPHGGRALVAGADVHRQPEELRQRIGYMPQTFSLYRDLSVAENLRFFAEAYQVPSRDIPVRIERLLAFSRLGPFSRTIAEHLSGGMRQKLALSCSMLHEPTILLLDEPTTGVDPVSRREFWDILYDLNRRGTTVLVATPYMDEAERCTRIGFMYGGRLLSVAPPEELRARMTGHVLEVIAEPRRRALAAVRGLDVVRTGSVFGDALHLTVSDAASAEPHVRAALTAAGINVQAVRAARPSLEDVFISLLARPEEVGART
ncbi:MAG: ABC transporter ATP-binding protein [Armatimonadetes bacterium]|nr:ABC transporter ATP-binding protein [Armatimonadota bacterium]